MAFVPFLKKSVNTVQILIACIYTYGGYKINTFPPTFKVLLAGLIIKLKEKIKLKEIIKLQEKIKF